MGDDCLPGSIHVLATTFDSTRSALAVALALAEDTDAHPTIFVAQIIPADGDLRARSRWTAFFANHYQNVVHEIGGDAQIDVCLCQSFMEVRARIPAAATVPNKVDGVVEALRKLQVTGLTVTEVPGHGTQKGRTAIYRGREYQMTLLPKMTIEVVAVDSAADDILKAIIEAARTGEIGDGRIFVLPVEEAYKIRTGERDVL
jgi:nitrogen regulatory protein PII